MVEMLLDYYCRVSHVIVEYVLGFDVNDKLETGKFGTFYMQMMI